jgi:hypothetical protein
MRKHGLADRIARFPGNAIAVCDLPAASRKVGNSILVAPGGRQRTDAVGFDRHTADIDFDGGKRKEASPYPSGMSPARPGSSAPALKTRRFRGRPSAWTRLPL